MTYYITKGGIVYDAPNSFSNPLSCKEGSYTTPSPESKNRLLEWLYTHTEKNSVRELVLHYVVAELMIQHPHHKPEHRSMMMLENGYEREFVVALDRQIAHKKVTRPNPLEKYLLLLIAEFQQEFCCIETNTDHADVTIGSVDVEWLRTLSDLPLIQSVKTITIHRPGSPTLVYHHKNTFVHNLDIPTFKVIVRSTYLEYLTPTKLSRGCAIVDMYDQTYPLNALVFWRNKIPVELKRHYKEIHL